MLGDVTLLIFCPDTVMLVVIIRNLINDNLLQIRASAVFIPELADPESDTEKYLFAYSIRMSLLPEGCVINGMTFSSCQLQRRHWIIHANNVVVSVVSGEAVIGMVWLKLIVFIFPPLL